MYKTTKITPIKISMYAVAGIIVLFVLAFLFMAGCALPKHTVGLDAVLAEELGKNRESLSGYRCTLGAHRGASTSHVENTLDAIASAVDDSKYAFIECDVQYSLDNKAVIFHDKRLKRVFGHRDKVGASTYDELLEMSKGEIATYAEIIDAAKGKRLNIEIKSQGDIEEDQRLVDFVMKDIKARKIEKRVLISSISEDVITYVKLTYPKMAAGQIFWIKTSTYLHLDFLTKNLYKRMEASQADYLMLHVANLRNIKDLLKLKPKGKTVVFWDFDDTMYVVHKDLRDRMWGDSVLRTALEQFRYRIRRKFSLDDGSSNLK